MARPCLALLALLAGALPACAALGRADELAERVRHARDVAETTGKAAAGAAHAAADTARQAAATARQAADSAVALKRAADESGLTDLVVDAGKGAVRRGIDRLAPRDAPVAPATAAAAAATPERAHNAASPARAAQPPARAAHIAAPQRMAAPRPRLHIDPALVRAAAAAVAALAAAVGAACAVLGCRAWRARAARDKVVLASLEPIFAASVPVPSIAADTAAAPRLAGFAPPVAASVPPFI